jgi:hypothetical protein
MKEHKHAAFLRAIADGASLSEFLINGTNASDMSVGDLGAIIFGQLLDAPDIVRVGKTRIINGFTVPAPETEAPELGANIFVPFITNNIFFSNYPWEAKNWDYLCLNRGLVFLTREAAVANAKAMLGIDPSKEEA